MAGRPLSRMRRWAGRSRKPGKERQFKETCDRIRVRDLGKTGKLAAAVVILGLAVVLYVARSGDGDRPTDRTDFQSRLKCAACGEDFVANLQIGAELPHACTKCGKKDAWPLWQCGGCSHLFVPSASGQPPRQPVMTPCPKCGGQSTGFAPVPE